MYYYIMLATTVKGSWRMVCYHSNSTMYDGNALPGDVNNRGGPQSRYWVAGL